MADITLKRGDLSRPISRRLKETITDEDAATTVTRGIDLTLATSVRLILKDQAGAATGGGVCTVTSATNGEVLYTTVTADTATVGRGTWSGRSLGRAAASRRSRTRRRRAGLIRITRSRSSLTSADAERT
jgi:hypothetical protein